MIDLVGIFTAKQWVVLNFLAYFSILIALLKIQKDNANILKKVETASQERLELGSWVSKIAAKLGIDLSGRRNG